MMPKGIVSPYFLHGVGTRFEIDQYLYSTMLYLTHDSAIRGMPKRRDHGLGQAENFPRRG
jgi:hypothetical protein